MEYSSVAIANKRKYLGAITSSSPFLRKIIETHIKEEYELKPLNREWEPGGGSALFQILTKTQKIFLKAMSLSIHVESKLEKENFFIEVPSIVNEYNFIKEIKDKVSSENVSAIIFYEEIEGFGFLATEWLEPFEYIKCMNIEEITQIYNKIQNFVRLLFENNIVHTDIHENNVRFRGKIPVIIDYGETRYFNQNIPFEKSLDYIGINKYGNINKMPIVNQGTIEGYTCLLRLKKVFDSYLMEKLLDFSKECNFDNSCPFNIDIFQEHDGRIYQSVIIGNLKIKGHRPIDDERDKLVKQICKLFALRYTKLIYIDIGSNLGKFCFEVSRLKKVIWAIGIEAFKNYLTFANGLKFIFDAPKVSFYNLIFGENDILKEIQEFRNHPYIKRFISLMSVYHHIENKEKCLDNIKELCPAGIIIEFATQERYYPERKNWRNELEYIKNKLDYKFSIFICESKDYERPIVMFTSDRILYSAALCIRLYILFKRAKFQLYRAKRKMRQAARIPLKVARYTLVPTQMRHPKRGDSYEKALQWLKDNRIENEGIPISSRRKIFYPEVTGYTVPTLYKVGEKQLAREWISWLISIQQPDGSFCAPDGKTPYTFDTGQVIRGFVSALDDLPEVEGPLRKACDWVLIQVQPDGRLATPSTEMWGDTANDSIHLYVLPPLIEAGEKLNEPKYIDAAHCVLEYYKQRKDLADFKMLSHFHAYVLEALCDLGETESVKSGMEQIAALQKPNGSIPAYPDVSWVCSTGVAQLAVIWYKLGISEPAEKVMVYLAKRLNRSGGFFGSYGRGANYFPDAEISWAVKFYLDAWHWRIKTSFDAEIDLFPDSINEQDGKMQEILSFFGNLNDEKVIDVGCGKGRFLRILRDKFPHAQLYGLDISEVMLRYCPQGVQTVCGSILDIRYPDATFDAVYCVEALEHTVRIEAAVREMCRILKPDGKILIIDKNKAKSGRLQISQWEKWFSRKEIEDLLQKYDVQAESKLIAYGQHEQPDGLFIAWQGVKRQGKGAQID